MTKTGSSVRTIPPEDIATQRRDGFSAVVDLSGQRFVQTMRGDRRKCGAGASDLQFTPPIACPSSISRIVRQHLPTARFWRPPSGVTVTDLDGNVFYDLTDSYGVNLFGHDFYKDCIARGAERVRDLGPVLGSYHPVVAYNVERAAPDLRAGRSIVSHVRHRGGDAGGAAGALSHRRSHLVRFCGAYHGWWGDVQPGIGNPSPAQRNLHAGGNVRTHAARAAHAPRHRLRPGQSAAGAASESRRPADSSLVDSGTAGAVSIGRPIPTG